MPELIVLSDVLEEFAITYEQLIDVGVLIGTDFNPDGIKGLGPKTALKLVKENGTLENALSHIKNAEFPAEPQKIRDIFLHPRVTNSYKLEWTDPNSDGIINFLYRQRDFSEDRVRRALDRIQESTSKLKGKTTLEKWFG
jgi:flap endonuclease-1